MKKSIVFLTLFFLISICAINIFAQRKVKLGKICGNPTLVCKGSEQFDPYELTFEIPKNALISDSESFYAIILKSVKLKSDTDCQTIISEDERLNV